VGTTEPVDYNRLRAAGVTDFIKKPLEASELIEKVQNFSIEPATQVHEAAKGGSPARAGTGRAGEEADAARIEELLGWSQPGAGAGARPAAAPPEEDDRTIVQPIGRPAPRPTPQAPAQPQAAPAPTAPVEAPRPAAARVTPAAPAASDGATAATLPPEALQALAAQIAREVVEKVAWEVVPALAETMIKEEIEKLKNAIPPDD
jgi:hypothetical protein